MTLRYLEERDLSSNEKTSSAGDENGPIGAASKYVSIVVLASLLLSSFGTLAWFDDVESGTNGWTHYWISGASVPDQWSISSSRRHSPSNSWYSGAEIANWVNGGDTGLESPAIDMTNASFSYLNFWHWYEFDTLVSGNTDGGIVEIDDGSGWTQIYPMGGYDGAIVMGNLNPLEGLQAFGGASLTWQYESFNISSYTGTVVRTRFHVGWDYGTTGLKEGWYIDDIEITNSTLPQHDLLVNGPIVPSKILPNTNVSVDGSVRNNGMSDEVNITVNLTADGALVDSQIIGFLQNGTNQPITLHWTPTVEKVFTLCLDVAPVPGEILTANNRNCVNANVRIAFHVAIYDHATTSDISYYSGGSDNNYQAFKNTLDSDPMSRFETSIVTDLYASTLSSFDALILPDNGVPDVHLADVASFFSSRKGIVAADSGACYLAYSGLLWPASAGSNGRGTFWAYDSNLNDQRVILSHEITADYSIGNILSSESNDASMYVSMLPADAIALTDSQSVPSNAYVVARDVAGGGRVVELGPFAYSTMPSNLLEMVRDAVFWASSSVPKDHDIAVSSFQLPKNVQPNDNVKIDAKIWNLGLNTETNIEVNLTVDGVLSDQQNITSMSPGQTNTLTLNWIPTSEKVYDLCVEVTPIPNENVTTNNKICTNVDVKKVKGFVLFDQTHNCYPVSFYSSFVGILNSLGYATEVLTATPLTASALAGYDVFVLAEPHSAYTSTERSVIQTFVSSGHGLLIWGDYSSFYSDITSFAGITWTSGGSWGITSDITPHDVTLGVTSIDLQSPGSRLTPSVPATSIVRDVGGGIALAVSETPGRVGAFTDDAAFADGYLNLSDNRILAINLIDWLVGRKYDHDIAISHFQLPSYVQPSDNVTIDVSIRNNGLNNETNVEVNITVDGIPYDKKNITLMVPGQTNAMAFYWIPTLEKVYTICIEVTPVPNENVTTNNKICTDINVRKVKAFILFDQTHNCYPASVYSSFIGVLNSLGYMTDVLTTTPLTASALVGYDVFVLAEPHSTYTSTERSVIQTFVSSGHGLLIWGDYASFYNDITSFAGITWTSGGSSGTTSDITPHEVTLGVASVDLISSGARLNPSAPVITLVRDVAGGSSLVVSEIPGRVGAFTDDAALANSYLNLSDNRVLAVNLIDWLVGRKYSHDVGITHYQFPKHIQPSDNVTIDVGIKNNGLNNETNVEVNVTIDGIPYDQKNISFMSPAQIDTLKFYWIPTLEKVYTICIEVTPVPNENVTTNNKICTDINVRKVKAFILFDQTHNCYPVSFYSSFMGILNSLGYVVDTLTSSPLTSSDLFSYDVFVLAEPHSAYTSTERGVIQTFVSSGHGLLIWGDYSSFYSDITSFAGITWTSGGSWGITSDITPHDVTLGVTSIDLQSPGSRLTPSVPATSIVRDVGGGIALAVSETPGRVGAFTDDAAFADGYLNLSDNRVLAINLIDWLVGTKYDHDVAISYFQLPKHVQPSDNVTIDASIRNNGLNNETNVEVNFTVDGILSDQKNISFMSPAQIDTLKFYWIPTLEKVYTICIEVTPVPNENVTTNNKICTDINVRKVKAFILFDQTHSSIPASFYSSFVGVLNSLGYVVDMLTSSPLTSSDLFSYDVFILPEPDMAYSGSELSAIQTFVSSGHGLLLWGDYSSSMYSDITSFAGITWASGGSFGTTSDITPHEVTTGVGSVYLPSPGRRLLLGASPTSLVRDVGGGIALAVSETPGRVGAFTDERAFYDSYLNMSYNRILAINLIDWLVGRKLLHDISIGQISIPSVLERWTPQTVQAVVRNVGLSDETNITVNLTYDGNDIDGILIPSLLSGSSYLVSFDLIPTSIGAHDVAIEISPIPNENLTTNNIAQEQVLVQDTTPPQTPSNFEVKNTPSPTELQLTWSPNTEPDLSHYTIYMSIDGVNYFFESKVIPPSCNYTDSGLLPGFRYYYQITASDDIPNESPRSSVSMGVPDVDTDGDGIVDLYDLDDDNDGVPDDQDDFPRDPTEWRDTDGDGIGDNADIDDDGDGVPDISDQFPRNPYEYIDSDGDGIGDNLDTDDDNDGVPDYQDAFPQDPTEWRDTDGDGIGDNADTDDDGDGVPDISDQFPRNPYEYIDSDGDGIGDNLDTDDDNDGVPDDQDDFPRDPTEWRDTDGDGIGDNADIDDDGDGVPDISDQFPRNPYEYIDSDGDGIGDNLDTDDDNDGVPDYQDAFPQDPTEWRDTDGDGIGDNADTDDDGDRVPDTNDSFPKDPNEWIDTDGDGLGDNHDPDDDNDGYSDLLEEQAGSDPKDPLSIPLDSDGDGIADVFDQDDDGDGVYDGQDAFPLDPAEWRDSDGDGIGDNADPDKGALDGDTRRSIELLGLIGLSLIVLLATLIIVIILTVFLYFREKRSIATEDEETIEEEEEEEGDDL